MKEEVVLAQDDNDSVCVLLAVWGEKFIQNFLQLSLPSLLAPGNMPALSAVYKTRFVFLTRERDAHVFEKDPAFQQLKKICQIEFISIEDLIVVGNYSTTLTLAYDRAIKQTGQAMLSTYFVFLTSDYIMADGSLKGLMGYIKKGYNGICAGNFQVNKEELEPVLMSRIHPDTNVLAIKPRELLKESLRCLHAITLASFFDQQIIHNNHANRFFLRVDSQVIAARFYLLHMLCIKPETMDYQIGSSCDYSFIPAMCPSGNVAVINDSDDYLVVEIQGKEHELGSVRWGQYHFKKLAYVLREWTTLRHRENANNSIYFHTRDLDEHEIKGIEDKLNRFISKLSQYLPARSAQSFDRHFYWHGAIGNFNDQRASLTGREDYEYVNLLSFQSANNKKKLFYRVFGSPPNSYRWHYRWLEYKLLTETFRRHIASNERVIILYEEYYTDFMRFSGWLRDKLKISHQYLLPNLKNAHAKLAELQQEQFDTCILMLKIEQMDSIKESIAFIKKMIKPDGKIVLMIPNGMNRYTNHLYDFQGIISSKIGSVMSADYFVDKAESIHSNLTMLGSAAVYEIANRFNYHRKMKFLFYCIVGLPGSMLSFIRSFLPINRKKKTSHCTNILLTLVPNNDKASG